MHLMLRSVSTTCFVPHCPRVVCEGIGEKAAVVDFRLEYGRIGCGRKLAIERGCEDGLGKEVLCAVPVDALNGRNVD